MPVAKSTLANAIRALSMDAIEQAQSGHPGMPMGMATIAEVLWNDFYCHAPRVPDWPNRDRFVLSNGHGAMLHYALLHLSGYDVQLSDLKAFRQLHAKTPGHPEVGLTPGVETTTGPLGQGLANAVGMAIAQQQLAARFNRPDYPLIDNTTYAFVGDGCLMEGISHECCSLAGTLGLAKLIVFWDDNGISIDGAVRGWFTDDTPARFRAYGWHVISDIDGHDRAAVHQAIVEAREQTDKPTLLCCRTTIGFGAPNLAGTAKIHGAPLGAEELLATKSALDWPHPPFHVPDAVYQAFSAVACGNERVDQWRSMFERYRRTYPECAAEFERTVARDLPSDWAKTKQQLWLSLDKPAGDSMATRKASQCALEVLAPTLPELIGGSADLTGSNLTAWSGSRAITRSGEVGNYLYYGVREFAMAAIMNGLSLYGGYRVYGGTFLTFLDYARNAVRMACLMKQPVIYVFTHDSIGLGEDGPTHQPIEHLSLLRITPNMSVWRPCDALETAVAWSSALEHTTGPTALALSRQKLPSIARTTQTKTTIACGGYILSACDDAVQLILLATGSEVHLAMAAKQELEQRGYKGIRVVSMPCVDGFKRQSRAYQLRVLPEDGTPLIIIEAGAQDYWYQFLRHGPGEVIGLAQFGESAPAEALYQHFGLTSEAIVSAAQLYLHRQA